MNGQQFNPNAQYIQRSEMTAAIIHEVHRQRMAMFFPQPKPSRFKALLVKSRFLLLLFPPAFMVALWWVHR